MFGLDRLLLRGITRDLKYILDELRKRLIVSIPNDEWKLEGVCNQVDPELFFPSRDDEGYMAEYNPVVAKRICSVCPVINECLEYALENNEQWGIWGGKSYVQRKEMHRQRGTLRQVPKKVSLPNSA